MSELVALRAAAEAGVEVRVDGDDLVLRAAAPPDPALLDLLKLHKNEILRIRRCGREGWSEEDWQALFDERAGIMEFDGGLSRSEAEYRASTEVEALRRFVRETTDG